jgi:hypothetical protein
MSSWRAVAALQKKLPSRTNTLVASVVVGMETGRGPCAVVLALKISDSDKENRKSKEVQRHSWRYSLGNSHANTRIQNGFRSPQDAKED